MHRTPTLCYSSPWSQETRYQKELVPSASNRGSSKGPLCHVMKAANGVQGPGLRGINSTQWPKTRHLCPTPTRVPFPSAQKTPFTFTFPPSFTKEKEGLPGRQGKEPGAAAWHLPSSMSCW